MLPVSRLLTIILGGILLLSTKNFSVRGDDDWQQKFEITRNISEALIEITDNLFSGQMQLKTFNLQIKLLDKNRKYLPVFQRIVDETRSLLNDTIAIKLKNGLPITPDHERHFCVLLVDSAASVRYLYKDLRKFHMFIDGFYFIVLQTFPNVQHYYNELNEIFEISLLHNIMHANVLVHAVNNVILLFHSMPFTSFYCRGVAPVIRNKFIDGSWLPKQFYWPKHHNLYGCPLVCAASQGMPYFQLAFDRSSGKQKFLGAEGKLLEYLADRMNFTVSVRALSAREDHQLAYDEAAAFGNIFASNTDFVIGGFHYARTSLNATFVASTSHFYSHYHFVVSAKTDPYDSFAKLLLPFEIEIWFVLFSIFVFVNIIIFPVAYLNTKFKYFVLGKGNNSPAYNMVVTSLGGPIPKDPKVPFSRCLLLLWLLATFILRIVYQDLMFHYIKSDVQNSPPKSVTDLLQNEYRILISMWDRSYARDLPQILGKAEVFNTSVLEAFDMLRRAQDDEKLAVLTPIEYYVYYKSTTPANEDLYVVPERLFSKPVSIYMDKRSAYLRRFNMYIRDYTRFGLGAGWDRLIAYTTKSRRVMDNSPKPLAITHLYAALHLLFTGLVAGCLVFVIEIFSSKIKALVRRLKRKLLKQSRNRNKQFVDRSMLGNTHRRTSA